MFSIKYRPLWTRMTILAAMAALAAVWPQATHQTSVVAWAQANATPTPTSRPRVPGLIAFTSFREGGVPKLYTMNADGSEQFRVDLQQDADSPSLRRAGRRIAFVSFVGAGSPEDGGSNAEIFSVDTDGANLRRLTNNSFADLNPVFSPDGTKIVFFSRREAGDDSGNGLYIMNADGSGERLLASRASSATWSPLGNKLLFVRATPVTPPPGSEAAPALYSQLCRINADGSGLVVLTKGVYSDLEWSPDGRRIVYVVSTADKLSTLIYTANPDGTNPRRLTIPPRSGQVLNTQPTWSPDNRYIAWVSDRDKINGTNYDIYRMKADGSEPTRLTFNARNDGSFSAIDFQPSWGKSEQDFSVVRLVSVSANAASELVTLRFSGPLDANLVRDGQFSVTANGGTRGIARVFYSAQTFTVQLQLYEAIEPGQRIRADAFNLRDRSGNPLAPQYGDVAIAQ